MQKTAPSLGRILAMVVFALSCFGIVLFLWVSFGGEVPLRPSPYQARVAFPEATSLADNADVRISGVTVGHVGSKGVTGDGSRTLVTLELDPEYAPIPADTRAILRQKTLLGESYVELTPGNAAAAGKLPDGATLSRSQVQPTVELDEILSTFGARTRREFRAFVKDSAKQIEGRSEELNAGLGNLAPFAHSGSQLLAVLHRQSRGLGRLIRNSGIALRALNDDRGTLRELISNSDRVFSATSQQRTALAQAFAIFPTFLDESRTTLARLGRFSVATDPLVNDLKPVADRLGPTVRDIGALSPDLERLFRSLPGLVDASRTGLPAAAKFLRGAAPLLASLHPFLEELDPILSYLNFYQQAVAQFLTNGGAAMNFRLKAGQTDVPLYTLPQFGVTNARSLSVNLTRPKYERANAYILPNEYKRALAFGVPESFSCANSETGGTKRDPTTGPEGSPPCFVAPPSLLDGNQFPRLKRGKSPVVPAPQGREGATPAQLPPG